MPPFACYEFEGEHEVSSTMPASQWEGRLRSLEHQWGLGPGSVYTQASDLRRWLSRGCPGMSGVLPTAPRVTIRFIRCIRLAEPIRQLLATGSPALWHFPRRPSGRRTATSPSCRPPLPRAPRGSERVRRLWRVAGGDAHGGILVRRGHELASAQLEERLSTGALVEELEVIGGRLRYRRLQGHGPGEGWVSLHLRGRALLEPAAGGVG